MKVQLRFVDTLNRPYRAIRERKARLCDFPLPLLPCPLRTRLSRRASRSLILREISLGHAKIHDLRGFVETLPRPLITELHLVDADKDATTILVSHNLQTR
jgi:hypothetical protein